MQEKLTIARPYAAAAYAYADEHGEIETWSGLLDTLALAVSDPALAALLGHPKVSTDQLVALIADILGTRLHTAGRNFLQALADADRLDLAPQIAEHFERRRAEQAGIVNVEVLTAYALSETEKQSIDAAVSGRMERKCAIESSVDQALIGGVVIKIGDSVIDLSLRGRLAALERQLG
ncbi:MAG: F0F1 ATP synthase subunit delta [Gammaproteobacteria bacterium]